MSDVKTRISELRKLMKEAGIDVLRAEIALKKALIRQDITAR